MLKMIKENVKVRKIMTMEDLDDFDVFTFVGTEFAGHIMMIADQTILDFSESEAYNVDEFGSEYEYAEVRILNAEMNILD